MMDSFKWAPKGFGSWLLDKNESPGIVRLRENKTYTRDVAAKLIEEKKKELKDGTSRRDLLSLLGPSCLSFLQQTNGRGFCSPVKANSALRPDWMLSDNEIVAQVR